VAQQIEGAGQVAAQAVAGDAVAGTFGQLAALLEVGVPRFHIVDLAEGKTDVRHLVTVRLQGVARGIVGEFGAAKGEDEFVGRGVPEQRAGESRFGVGDVLDDSPVFVQSREGHLAGCKAAGAFVACGKVGCFTLSGGEFDGAVPV
jgi:hypothetical protein